MRLRVITGIASVEKRTMKLRSVFYKRNLMLIYLIMSVLLSLTVVNIPVKGLDEVRVYVVPEPPDYISGVPVGGDVYVDVYIDSPAEWYNDNVTGIVGWAMSIKVDPDVLEPWSIYAATGGYFLYDFASDTYGGLTTLLKTTDKPNGLFYEVSEFIQSWESPPFNGAGAGDTGKLCRLRFKSKNETAFSLIDLGYPAEGSEFITVYYYTASGKFEVDVIGDGYYNPPPPSHTLAVESTPIDGINFTIDTTTYTTNATVELEGGLYIVTMPSTWMVGGDQYNFVEWEDDSTNPVRTISLTSDMTITATYELRARPSAYIAVVPQSIVNETYTVGTVFNISIYTDYNGSDVWGWEFTLTYNPSVLQGIEVTNGDLITDTTLFLTLGFDNELGKLKQTGNGFFFLPGDPILVTSGPGTLATVTFQVVGTGDSNLTLGTETLAPTRLIGINTTTGEHYNIIDDITPDVGHILHGYFRTAAALVYTLTVESTPITGVEFTIGMMTYTTNVMVELAEGNYTVTMPSTWTAGADQYNFVEWENKSTNPIRSISLTFNMTIVATYELKLFPPMSSFTFSPTEPIVAETVIFDASASNDPDGTIVSYAWDFGDGTTTNETDPVTTYAYANAGTYTVALMVTDNDELTDTVSKSIIIRKLSSSISITASPTTMKLGENTTISGSITPTRANATVTIWYRLSGEEIWSTLVILITDLNGQYSYTWTPTVAGTFELKASWSGDTNTLPAESSVITITVVPLLPPVASFTWEPEKPYVGDSVVFDASASYDLDGVIVSYNWDFGDATTSNTTEPFIEHTYNETNTYAVALTVIDNDGVTSTATAHITVIHRMLSVELSGEFDYLLREVVRIKIAALVTDITTVEPVSNVDVNIQIYDDDNELWISSVMTESPAGTGIYVWTSNGTIKELRLTKGIYLVRVGASFRDGPTAYDMILFHIDPPAGGTNETLYYIALIAIISATATGLIFKRQQIIKRLRRLMRTYVNVLTFD